MADTEGMFLLMAIGYIIAGSVLFSEIVGGCAKSCRAFIRRSSVADGDSRRGSTFSDGQNQSDESRTFAEKMRHNIRRRLRPKSKHQDSDVQSEDGKSGEQIKSGAANTPEQLNEPEKLEQPEKLKGSTLFCTIKRIMLMRKQRKEQKKAITDEAKEQQANQLEIEVEHSNEVDESAIGGEASNVTIENEKCGGIEDGDCLTCSSSMSSDSQVIKEETEAEINQLSVDSDRENNPSKEFGELV